jgi:hypothetical protein
LRDTSNIQVGHIVDTSNYITLTSNIVMESIIGTSNYIKNTSNILISRISDTSNYTRNTSNILIGHNRDTSNYTKDTSNILIGMIKTVQSSGTSTSQWTTANNKIYYNTSNIGIGTNNPVSKLHLYEEVNFESKLTIQNYFNDSLVSNPIASESGSITGSSTDKFMIFKDPTITYILTVPEGGISCDILMIGGGGSGWFGGGGAGACIIVINQSFTQGTYNVYVGAGGNNTNNNGGDSKIIIVNTVNNEIYFSAKGGGTGGRDDGPDNTGIGVSGGCGGGAQGVSTYSNNVRAGGASVSTNIVNKIQNIGPTGPTTSGINYAVLGNKGGSKTINDANLIYMGGGGIGAPGPDYTNTNNILIPGTGDGGAGLNAVTINSKSYNFKSYFANGLPFGHNDNGYIGGGGGGDIRTAGNSPDCVGGIGGGGFGIDPGKYDGDPGATNTGSGGGTGGNRGFGGSGIVVIRYRPLITPLQSSSYIELIRGTSSDTSDDYMIGNYNDQFKIKSSRSNSITDRLVINSIGNVGIGKSNPSYTLDVVPILPYNTNIPASGSTFSLSGTTTGINYFTIQQNTVPICAKFNGGIWVEGCYATTSDIRTKEDIQDINDNCALLKILAIEPKTYKYIDKVEKGDKKVYGFIAQQIQEVIPEAISLEKSYIPNIMLCAEYYNKIITLPYLPTKVTINVKDKIKCFDINNNCIEIEVTKILNELAFEIKDLDKEYKSNKIFVYGTYVSDFHTLSKEHIFSLNVGATQELYRLIKNNENIIKSQEERMNILEKKNEVLNKEYDNLLEELELVNQNFS